MIWKSQYYLHILQAELTDVDFWKNSVLFRIRGLIPNLCEGKVMKSCQEEGTLEKELYQLITWRWQKESSSALTSI